MPAKRRTPRTMKNTKYSPDFRQSLRTILGDYMNKMRFSADDVLLEVEKLFPEASDVVFKKSQELSAFLRGRQFSDRKIELLIKYLSKVYPEMMGMLDRENKSQFYSDIIQSMFSPSRNVTRREFALRRKFIEKIHGTYACIWGGIGSPADLYIFHLEDVGAPDFCECFIFVPNVLPPNRATNNSKETRIDTELSSLQSYLEDGEFYIDRFENSVERRIQLTIREIKSHSENGDSNRNLLNIKADGFIIFDGEISTMYMAEYLYKKPIIGRFLLDGNYIKWNLHYVLGDDFFGENFIDYSGLRKINNFNIARQIKDILVCRKN